MSPDPTTELLGAFVVRAIPNMFVYFRDIGLLSYNDFGELCYDVVFVGDQSIKLVFICRKTSALELYLEQSFCLYTVICSSVSLSP